MPELITAAEIDGQPSHDDLRALLMRALNPGDIWGPSSTWVNEVGDGACIVSRDGQNYRYPYTVSADGQSVTLGTPEPVKLAWEPVKLAWEPVGGAEVAATDEEPGTRAFVTDLRGLQFSEGAATTRIEVCRDGTWKHPKWGDIKVDTGLREKLVRNFAENVRKVGDLPLDYDHVKTRASGWIRNLENQGTSLYADVDLTPAAAEAVRNGEYRFFSPEYHLDWKDPETGQAHGPTLFGGALTNNPFFRGMQAICCSEFPPTGGRTGEQSGGAGDGAANHEAPTERQMSETQTPPAGAEAGTITAAEVAALQGAVQAAEARLQAVEVENAGLRTMREQDTLTQTFSEMSFGEGGKRKLAPASRNAAVEALMKLPSEHRQPVADLIRTLTFAELGERGFAAEEPAAIQLSEAEETSLRDLAKRNGLEFEAVKQTFLETKQRRAA